MPGITAGGATCFRTSLVRKAGGPPASAAAALRPSFRALQRLLVNHPEAPAIADIGKLIEEMRFRDALEQLQALPLDYTTGGED